MSTAMQTWEVAESKATKTSVHHRKRNNRPDAGVERTYSLKDVDLLDCPLCFKSLDSRPIYQCQNGHIACSVCCEKLRKCPTCSQPTGSIRCTYVERILASLEMSCKYACYGCAGMLRMAYMQYHERSCHYRPFPCPFLKCVYEGSRITIPLHLAKEHQVPIVEHNGISGARFTMTPSDRIVMVKDEEDFGTGCMFVHRESVHETYIRGDLFFCTSVRSYYHEFFHLKVAYQGEVGGVAYSMRSALIGSLRNVRDYLNGDFLILPLCKSKSVQSRAESNELSIEVHLEVSNCCDRHD